MAGNFNGVIEIYPRLARVAVVMKIWDSTWNNEIIVRSTTDRQTESWREQSYKQSATDVIITSVIDDNDCNTALTHTLLSVILRACFMQ